MAEDMYRVTDVPIGEEDDDEREREGNVGTDIGGVGKVTPTTASPSKSEATIAEESGSLTSGGLLSVNKINGDGSETSIFDTEAEAKSADEVVPTPLHLDEKGAKAWSAAVMSGASGLGHYDTSGASESENVSAAASQRVSSDGKSNSGSELKQMCGVGEGESWTEYIKRGGYVPSGWEITSRRLLTQERVAGLEEKWQDGEMGYEDFLMRAYGYDILKGQGEDVHSVSYWYNKMQNGDYSSPLDSDYRLNNILSLAEAQYNSDKSIENLATAQFDVVDGEKMTTETFAEIFGRQFTDEFIEQLGHGYDWIQAKYEAGLLDLAQFGASPLIDANGDGLITDGDYYYAKNGRIYKLGEGDAYITRKDANGSALEVHVGNDVGNVAAQFGVGILDGALGIFDTLANLVIMAIDGINGNNDIATKKARWENEWKADLTYAVDGHSSLGTISSISHAVGSITGMIGVMVLTAGLGGVASGIQATSAGAGAVAAGSTSWSVQAGASIGRHIASEGLKKAIAVGLKGTSFILSGGNQFMNGAVRISGAAAQSLGAKGFLTLANSAVRAGVLTVRDVIDNISSARLIESARPDIVMNEKGEWVENPQKRRTDADIVGNAVLMGALNWGITTVFAATLDDSGIVDRAGDIARSVDQMKHPMTAKFASWASSTSKVGALVNTAADSLELVWTNVNNQFVRSSTMFGNAEGFGEYISMCQNYFKDPANLTTLLYSSVMTYSGGLRRNQSGTAQRTFEGSNDYTNKTFSETMTLLNEEANNIRVQIDEASRSGDIAKVTKLQETLDGFESTIKMMTDWSSGSVKEGDKSRATSAIDDGDFGAIIYKNRVWTTADFENGKVPANVRAKLQDVVGENGANLKGKYIIMEGSFVGGMERNLKGADGATDTDSRANGRIIYSREPAKGELSSADMSSNLKMQLALLRFGDGTLLPDGSLSPSNPLRKAYNKVFNDAYLRVNVAKYAGANELMRAYVGVARQGVSLKGSERAGFFDRVKRYTGKFAEYFDSIFDLKKVKGDDILAKYFSEGTVASYKRLYGDSKHWTYVLDNDEGRAIIRNWKMIMEDPARIVETKMEGGDDFYKDVEITENYEEINKFFGKQGAADLRQEIASRMTELFDIYEISEENKNAYAADSEKNKDDVGNYKKYGVRSDKTPNSRASELISEINELRSRFLKLCNEYGIDPKDPENINRVFIAYKGSNPSGSDDTGAAEFDATLNALSQLTAATTEDGKARKIVYDNEGKPHKVYLENFRVSREEEIGEDGKKKICYTITFNPIDSSDLGAIKNAALVEQTLLAMRKLRHGTIAEKQTAFNNLLIAMYTGGDPDAEVTTNLQVQIIDTLVRNGFLTGAEVCAIVRHSQKNIKTLKVKALEGSKESTEIEIPLFKGLKLDDTSTGLDASSPTGLILEFGEAYGKFVEAHNKLAQDPQNKKALENFRTAQNELVHKADELNNLGYGIIDRVIGDEKNRIMSKTLFNKIKDQSYLPNFLLNRILELSSSVIGDKAALKDLSEEEAAELAKQITDRVYEVLGIGTKEQESDLVKKILNIEKKVSTIVENDGEVGDSSPEFTEEINKIMERIRKLEANSEAYKEDNDGEEPTWYEDGKENINKQFLLVFIKNDAEIMSKLSTEQMAYLCQLVNDRIKTIDGTTIGVRYKDILKELWAMLSYESQRQKQTAALTNYIIAIKDFETVRKSDRVVINLAEFGTVAKNKIEELVTLARSNPITYFNTDDTSIYKAAGGKGTIVGEEQALSDVLGKNRYTNGILILRKSDAVELFKKMGYKDLADPDIGNIPGVYFTPLSDFGRTIKGTTDYNPFVNIGRIPLRDVAESPEVKRDVDAYIYSLMVSSIMFDDNSPIHIKGLDLISEALLDDSPIDLMEGDVERHKDINFKNAKTGGSSAKQMLIRAAALSAFFGGDKNSPLQKTMRLFYAISSAYNITKAYLTDKPGETGAQAKAPILVDKTRAEHLEAFGYKCEKCKYGDTDAYRVVSAPENIEVIFKEASNYIKNHQKNFDGRYLLTSILPISNDFIERFPIDVSQKPKVKDAYGFVIGGVNTDTGNGYSMQYDNWLAMNLDNSAALKKDNNMSAEVKDILLGLTYEGLKGSDFQAIGFNKDAAEGAIKGAKTFGDLKKAVMGDKETGEIGLDENDYYSILLRSYFAGLNAVKSSESAETFGFLFDPQIRKAIQDNIDKTPAEILAVIKSLKYKDTPTEADITLKEQFDSLYSGDGNDIQRGAVGYAVADSLGLRPSEAQFKNWQDNLTEDDIKRVTDTSVTFASAFHFYRMDMDEADTLAFKELQVKAVLARTAYIDTTTGKFVYAITADDLAGFDEDHLDILKKLIGLSDADYNALKGYVDNTQKIVKDSLGGLDQYEGEPLSRVQEHLDAAKPSGDLDSAAYKDGKIPSIAHEQIGAREYEKIKRQQEAKLMMKKMYSIETQNKGAGGIQSALDRFADDRVVVTNPASYRIANMDNSFTAARLLWQYNSIYNGINEALGKANAQSLTGLGLDTGELAMEILLKTSGVSYSDGFEGAFMLGTKEITTEDGEIKEVSSVDSAIRTGTQRTDDMTDFISQYALKSYTGKKPKLIVLLDKDAGMTSAEMKFIVPDAKIEAPDQELKNITGQDEITYDDLLKKAYVQNYLINRNKDETLFEFYAKQTPQIRVLKGLADEFTETLGLPREYSRAVLQTAIMYSEGFKDNSTNLFSEAVRQNIYRKMIEDGKTPVDAERALNKYTEIMQNIIKYGVTKSCLPQELADEIDTLGDMLANREDTIIINTFNAIRDGSVIPTGFDPTNEEQVQALVRMSLLCPQSGAQYAQFLRSIYGDNDGKAKMLPNTKTKASKIRQKFRKLDHFVVFDSEWLHTDDGKYFVTDMTFVKYTREDGELKKSDVLTITMPANPEDKTTSYKTYRSEMSRSLKKSGYSDSQIEEYFKKRLGHSSANAAAEKATFCSTPEEAFKVVSGFVQDGDAVITYNGRGQGADFDTMNAAGMGGLSSFLQKNHIDGYLDLVSAELPDNPEDTFIERANSALYKRLFPNGKLTNAHEAETDCDMTAQVLDKLYGAKGTGGIAKSPRKELIDETRELLKKAGVVDINDKTIDNYISLAAETINKEANDDYIEFRKTHNGDVYLENAVNRQVLDSAQFGKSINIINALRNRLDFKTYRNQVLEDVEAALGSTKKILDGLKEYHSDDQKLMSYLINKTAQAGPTYLGRMAQMVIKALAKFAYDIGIVDNEYLSRPQVFEALLEINKRSKTGEFLSTLTKLMKGDVQFNEEELNDSSLTSAVLARNRVDSLYDQIRRGEYGGEGSSAEDRHTARVFGKSVGSLINDVEDGAFAYRLGFTDDLFGDLDSIKDPKLKAQMETMLKIFGADATRMFYANNAYIHENKDIDINDRMSRGQIAKGLGTFFHTPKYIDEMKSIIENGGTKFARDYGKAVPIEAGVTLKDCTGNTVTMGSDCIVLSKSGFNALYGQEYEDVIGRYENNEIIVSAIRQPADKPGNIHSFKLIVVPDDTENLGNSFIGVTPTAMLSKFCGDFDGDNITLYLATPEQSNYMRQIWDQSNSAYRILDDITKERIEYAPKGENDEYVKARELYKNNTELRNEIQNATAKFLKDVQKGNSPTASYEAIVKDIKNKAGSEDEKLVDSLIEQYFAKKSSTGISGERFVVSLTNVTQIEKWKNGDADREKLATKYMRTYAANQGIIKGNLAKIAGATGYLQTMSFLPQPQKLDENFDVYFRPITVDGSTEAALQRWIDASNLTDEDGRKYREIDGESVSSVDDILTVLRQKQAEAEWNNKTYIIRDPSKIQQINKDAYDQAEFMRYALEGVKNWQGLIDRVPKVAGSDRFLQDIILKDVLNYISSAKDESVGTFGTHNTGAQPEPLRGYIICPVEDASIGTDTIYLNAKGLVTIGVVKGGDNVKYQPGQKIKAGAVIGGKKIPYDASIFKVFPNGDLELIYKHQNGLPTGMKVMDPITGQNKNIIGYKPDADSAPEWVKKYFKTTGALDEAAKNAAGGDSSFKVIGYSNQHLEFGKAKGQLDGEEGKDYFPIKDGDGNIVAYAVRKDLQVVEDVNAWNSMAKDSVVDYYAQMENISTSEGIGFVGGSFIKQDADGGWSLDPELNRAKEDLRNAMVYKAFGHRNGTPLYIRMAIATLCQLAPESQMDNKTKLRWLKFAQSTEAGGKLGLQAILTIIKENFNDTLENVEMNNTQRALLSKELFEQAAGWTFTGLDENKEIDAYLSKRMAHIQSENIGVGTFGRSSTTLEDLFTEMGKSQGESFMPMLTLINVLSQASGRGILTPSQAWVSCRGFEPERELLTNPIVDVSNAKSGVGGAPIQDVLGYIAGGDIDQLQLTMINSDNEDILNYEDWRNSRTYVDKKTGKRMNNTTSDLKFAILMRFLLGGAGDNMVDDTLNGKDLVGSLGLAGGSNIARPELYTADNIYNRAYLVNSNAKTKIVYDAPHTLFKFNEGSLIPILTDGYSRPKDLFTSNPEAQDIASFSDIDKRRDEYKNPDAAKYYSANIKLEDEQQQKIDKDVAQQTESMNKNYYGDEIINRVKDNYQQLKQDYETRQEMIANLEGELRNDYMRSQAQEPPKSKSELTDRELNERNTVNRAKHRPRDARTEDYTKTDGTYYRRNPLYTMGVSTNDPDAQEALNRFARANTSDVSELNAVNARDAIADSERETSYDLQRDINKVRLLLSYSNDTTEAALNDYVTAKGALLEYEATKGSKTMNEEIFKQKFGFSLEDARKTVSSYETRNPKVAAMVERINSKMTELANGMTRRGQAINPWSLMTELRKKTTASGASAENKGRLRAAMRSLFGFTVVDTNQLTISGEDSFIKAKRSIFGGGMYVDYLANIEELGRKIARANAIYDAADKLPKNNAIIRDYVDTIMRTAFDSEITFNSNKTKRQYMFETLGKMLGVEFQMTDDARGDYRNAVTLLRTKIEELVGEEPQSLAELRAAAEGTPSGSAQRKAVEYTEALWQVYHSMLACSPELVDKVIDSLEKARSTGTFELTDRFGRIISVNNDTVVKKPLFDGDLDYINEFICDMRDNNTDYRLALAVKAMAGEVYLLDSELAHALDRNVYTTKIPGVVMGALQKSARWCSKMLMSQPLKLIRRLMQMTMYDTGMAMTVNPKSIMYMPQAMREVSAYFASKGAVIDRPEYATLKQYLQDQGFHIGDVKGYDPSTMESGTGSKVFNIPFNEIGKLYSEQNLFGRYALYLATLDDLENNPQKVHYGVMYHKKGMIDGMSTNGQKAITIVDATLGGPGGFSELSRTASRYGMVFTTFPLAVARWAGEGVATARAVVRDLMAGEAKFGDVMRNLGTPILTIGASYGVIYGLIMAMCSLFGVKEEDAKEMAKNQEFIDPIQSILNDGVVMVQDNSIFQLQQIIDAFDSFKENEGFGAQLLGFVNDNFFSHFNPILKAGVESFSNTDFYGSQMVKNDYSLQDNVTRKMLSFIIGGAGANAYIKEKKMQSLGGLSENDTKFGAKLKAALEAELGNTKAYKSDKKSYQKSLSYTKQFLKNYYNQNNIVFDDDDYDYNNVSDLSTAIRYAIEKGKGMDYVWQLVDHALDNGANVAEIKSALRSSSITYKLQRIEQLGLSDRFYTNMSEEMRNQIERAILFEDAYYPYVDDIIAKIDNDVVVPSQNFSKGYSPTAMNSNFFAYGESPYFSPYYYRQPYKYNTYDRSNYYIFDNYVDSTRYNNRYRYPAGSQYERKINMPELERLFINRLTNYTGSKALNIKDLIGDYYLRQGIDDTGSITGENYREHWNGKPGQSDWRN